jgi:hypothetical protein
MFIVGGNHKTLQRAGERRHPHVDAAVVHFRGDACKQEPVTEQDVQVRETETAKSEKQIVKLGARLPSRTLIQAWNSHVSKDSSGT